MDYQEFKEKVYQITGTKHIPVFNKKTRKYDEIEIEELVKKWVIGGEHGGSCWGREPRPVTAEPEPEFEQLDAILEGICPHISFLQYKRICTECIETDTDSETEYYGNWTEYAIKKVKLSKLFDVLKEKNIL